MPDLTSKEAMYLVLAALAVIGLVVVVDFVLFLAWAMRKEAVDAGQARPTFAPRWSLADPWIGGQLALILVATLTGGITAVAGYLSGGMRLAGGDLTGAALWAMLISVAGQNVVLVGVSGWYLFRKYRATATEVGLTRPSARLVVIGLAAGVGVMLLGGALELGLNWAIRHLLPVGLSATLRHLSAALSAESLTRPLSGSPGMYALFVVGAGLLAPIGEEFFFRAFLYNCAKRRLGIGLGLLVSALAFGFAHGGPLLVLAIVPMGLVLGIAYEWSGSLWVPILMHAVNNTVGLLAAYVGGG